LSVDDRVIPGGIVAPKGMETRGFPSDCSSVGHKEASDRLGGTGPLSIENRVTPGGIVVLGDGNMGCHERL